MRTNSRISQYLCASHYHLLEHEGNIMAFDKETNTITVGKDSDILVDSGLVFINTIKNLSQDENPAPEIISAWQVIETWLRCEGREITKDDEIKILKAWKSYLAIGLAPSFKLQPTFDTFSNQYKEAGYSFKEDKPPAKIMDLFDRLVATKEELKSKRNHDWEEENKKFEKILKSSPKKLTLKQKIPPFKRNTRILIVASIAWFFWVIFRTSDDYELLGIDLYQWDDDMFLANSILPILVAWLAVKSYKWVNKAEK